MEANVTGTGGYKEIIFMITGKGAYSKLKYENGAHRVQRVPETESGGRIHTSTATVACLPEAEEVEVDIHERHPRRYIRIKRTGRTKRKHDDVGRTPDAFTDRCRRFLSG